MDKRSKAIAEWSSTGLDLPPLSGSVALPPGDNGNLDIRRLFFRAIITLYTCVGTAQGAPAVDDPETHAVHQLLVSCGSLAASEADAFLRLVSIGLEQPATVHLRGLGESVRRMVLCETRPDLALELYRSAEPSWRKIASTLPIADAPEFTKGEVDMRKLEQMKHFAEARTNLAAEKHLMSDLEWTMWSKRTHGDIFALVQVAIALRSRTASVAGPINRYQSAGEADLAMMRAIGFTLAGIASMHATFGIDSQGAIERLFDDFAEMQDRTKPGMPPERISDA